jgi:peptide/nickel transport system substrate-binding protein
MEDFEAVASDFERVEPAGSPRQRRITRRRLLALTGVSTVGLLLGACAPSAAPGPTASAPKPTVAAPTSGPAAGSAASPAVSSAPASSPSPSPAAIAPTAAVAEAPSAPAAVSSPGRTLRILSWQAPKSLNPYLGSGNADLTAARCCLEPLLTVDNTGRLEPVLAAEVPSRENGGLPNDRTVVYRLKSGVTWADGRPFTASDVAFTYELLSNPETAATTTAAYRSVESVDAVDSLTVRITFLEPTSGWFVPFVGSSGLILPRHAFDGYAGPDARAAPFNTTPFGTGPFLVEDFAPGDRISFAPNAAFREPGRPTIGRIELKGGGDAVTAARAVLQTGEYDYAWNLQVEGPVLQDIADDGRGQLVTSTGAGVELLLLNQADPNVEVDGERSAPSTRHPFLTDPVVRRAMALAIDRPTLARELYGGIAGDATANLLTTPTDLAWPGARIEVDLAQANRLLDEAGYSRGADGIRATPTGVRLKVLFATSVNSLRQKEQALIKDGWQKLGIETELRAIDSSAYFATGTNPDSVVRFHADVVMLTVPFTSPYPAALMKRFYGKDPARDWAQKANSWAPANIVKWADPEYDRVYDQALTETDPGRARELWRRLDELAVSSNVVVPLVDRKFVSAKASAVVGPSPRSFDVETWNVAAWTIT